MRATSSASRIPDFGPQIDALFLPWVLERTKAQVMQEAQSQGVPVGALHTMEDIFENPQLRERAYFTLLDHPEAGRLEYPGPPFKLSETPAQIRRAPLLGEHTSEVLTGRLGYSRQEVVILRQRGVV